MNHSPGLLYGDPLPGVVQATPLEAALAEAEAANAAAAAAHAAVALNQAALQLQVRICQDNI